MKLCFVVPTIKKRTWTINERAKFGRIKCEKVSDEINKKLQTYVEPMCCSFRLLNQIECDYIERFSRMLRIMKTFRFYLSLNILNKNFFQWFLWDIQPILRANGKKKIKISNYLLWFQKIKKNVLLNMLLTSADAKVATLRLWLANDLLDVVPFDDAYWKVTPTATSTLWIAASCD